MREVVITITGGAWRLCGFAAPNGCRCFCSTSPNYTIQSENQLLLTANTPFSSPPSSRLCLHQCFPSKANVLQFGFIRFQEDLKKKHLCPGGRDDTEGLQNITGRHKRLVLAPLMCCELMLSGSIKQIVHFLKKYISHIWPSFKRDCAFILHFL